MNKEYYASISLTDWGVSLGGEHFTCDIDRDMERVEVDQEMGSGLAGRLNKKDSTRSNRPGDRTIRFETRESAIDAGVEKARELWPDIKLILVGGRGNPCQVAWAVDDTIQRKMNNLHRQMEQYYALSNDPWGAGFGEQVDAIYKRWDILLGEFE